jgi:ubiquinone/menaquinone biosynthesis C-methylase UbiE
MAAGADTSKAAAWERHWRSGALSSLSAGNRSAEPQEAQDAWVSFFALLPPNAALLDIATGNGVVAALAQGYARTAGCAFAITGIDQAAIDPAGSVTEHKELLEGVRFIGKVSAETLPFPAASFDAVTGQYALEYTEAAKTLAEVARVLKKGGRARFVLHAEQSVTIQFNRPKVAQGSYFLSESGVFEALQAAVTAATEGRNVEATRAAFRDKAVEARETLKGMGENAELQQLLQNLVQAYIGRARFDGLATFLRWLRDVQDEVAGQVAMITAMDEAALSSEAFMALKEAFEKQGFVAEVGELHAGPDQAFLAWTLSGVKF